MSWDLSCPDWRDRLKDGRPLVPDLPLWQEQALRAVRIFNKLRIYDVPGTPTMEEASGDWFRAIVAALFGSLDPVTKERLIRELFLLVPKKNSKALALDTLIATPTGFTTMGDVQVGDLVMAADGTPTPVICKSEVFTGRRCLEVEFSTGEVVLCDEQHLWVTDAHRDRERQQRDRRSEPAPSVKTTAEIERTLKVPSGRYLINNHRTALAGALDLPEAELPIPPYVLGAWLGDGGTNGALITSGVDDAEHLVRAIAATGHPARITRRDPRSNAVTISLASECRNVRGVYRFRTEAMKLGVFGAKSIPNVYLRASRQQRLDLVRGLMDTDGCISKAGQATFVTTQPSLRDGIIELIASLGLKPSVSEHRATFNGRDCGPCWRVQFWPFGDLVVFNLPRKAERQRSAQVRHSPRSRSRQIVAVREIESVPTQCIGVASDCHQFLVTRSLIPTHNTTNGALLMLTALLLNERPRAPYLLTAPLQKTADEAFACAAGAIALDPVLDKRFHVKDYKKLIVDRQTQAKLEITTFDPDMVTGKKVCGLLVDEPHVLGKMAKAAKAMLQLRGGMQPFPEAFLVEITTQSDEQPAGVFREDLIRAREVRDGKRKSPVLPVLYEFPEEMQADPAKPWRDPKVWHMVTPNSGRSLSIDRLHEAFVEEEAKGDEALRLWASQHLNIEIGLAMAAAGWVGAKFWEACGDRKVTLDYLLEHSEVLTFGVDGGGLDDLLGASALGREVGTGRWLHWGHAWAHPSVLDRRKDIASRLLDFEKDGDLTIVKNVGDDVVQVADYVERCDQSGLLDMIGVDPIGIGAIVEEIVGRKIDHDRCIGVPQGYALMGSIQTVERKLAAKQLVHGGRPLMAWSVGNAKPEPRGNAVMITKQVAGSAKIDPLISLFNAAALMARNPKPRKRKFQMFFA